MGSLELLLSTPLGVRDILRGQLLALRRQFLGPIVVVAIIVLAWAVARSLLPDGTALNLANNRQCMQLADWLSRGLDATRAVTSLFWYSIFAVPLIFGFNEKFDGVAFLLDLPGDVAD